MHHQYLLEKKNYDGGSSICLVLVKFTRIGHALLVMMGTSKGLDKLEIIIRFHHILLRF